MDQTEDVEKPNSPKLLILKVCSSVGRIYQHVFYLGLRGLRFRIQTKNLGFQIVANILYMRRNEKRIDRVSRYYHCQAINLPESCLFQIFQGNRDRLSRVYNYLKNPTLTLSAQLRPYTWHGKISMRLDIYECKHREPKGAYASFG